MAPQTSIPVAANVLGTIGTGFGVFSWYLSTYFTSKAIWTNWRTKKTDGLPALMMFLWGVCGVPFGAYAIIQNFNYPIQVQPQAFMTLCVISWSQIMVYGNGWSVKKATLAGLAMAAIFAGVEAALIFSLRPIYERGNEAPAIVVGIIASILLAAGLVPPYFEIYKRRGRIVGINFVFLAMDWSGAFFSLMALVAQNTFDVLGGVIYIICALLEIGIFLSHIIWRIRTRKLRQQAKAEGKTFDELAAEIIAVRGADNFPFAERPLHPCFSSAWWRNRFMGRSTKQSDARDPDLEAAATQQNVDDEKKEQAMPSETLGVAETLASPPYLYGGPSVFTSAASTPAIATTAQAPPKSATKADDVCRSRSCSDSVAPTQWGEVETDFDEKR
ncbi:hypothetical protein HMPREF1624_04940 [Sporothrix schenckii ATCC 58251]|uniref:PQ loop repeat protein n=1 Tax=Sporothrix schenckii (strain ATCC 58251 / de Perez 2211183) TaxID=1391915 RepID=U7PTS5_SPOS1|nr:hypothetical protein HMPREF1624_04940 [Sporothrix schenckii ATCC 58251]